VIIGAGFAGLGAAQHLLQRTSFVVLEGRNRVGGRVMTTQDQLPYPIDLGAAWIHHTKTNPVYESSMRLGVPIRFNHYSHGFFPKLNHQEFRHKLWPEFLKTLSREQKAIKEDSSKQDYSLREFADQFISKNSIHQDLDIFESLLHLTYVGEYAADLKDMSLAHFDDDVELRGSDAYLSLDKIPGGYGAIVEGLAEPLRQHIQLNCTVTQINNQDPSNIIVSYKNKFSQSCTILAKHVICTVSLGVLKANSIKFCPPLPPKKQLAIDALGMAHLNKCILYWHGMETVFWPKDTEWLIRVVEPKLNLVSHASKYDRDNNNVSSVEFVDFYNAYSLNGGLPLLVGYVAGSDAIQMEHLMDDAIVQCALHSLECMFGHAIPSPTHTIVTRWSNDPLSQGGYSFLKVNSTNQHRRDLAEPTGGLWFAGEATHTLHPATTHGAMISGTNVAIQVLRQLSQ